MPDTPTVAVVIPSHNGARYLADCLESVGELEYRREALETIVVDDGSTDSSQKLLRDRYPWVRVVRQERQLGFAAAVNAGAAASSADCVALANNDMRLDSGWLRELVQLYAPEKGYPCVAGVILDWNGERVDFVDGFINFHGAAGQEHFGRAVGEIAIEDGRQLAFACGGSMLVDRRLFLDLGGFDPAFFALLEDVDFGWRLRLAGHGIRLAGGARSFHHHGATTGALGADERLFLFERNALLMLFKNLDDANLGRVLAPSLLLLTERARAAEAPLRAVADVLSRLDDVLTERARVQSLRRCSDADVLATFKRPFFATRGEEAYLEAEVRLNRLFGLDELFSMRRAAHLLVVGSRPRMAELATAAAAVVEVERTTPSAAELEGLLAGADAVLAEAGASLPDEIPGRLAVDLNGAGGNEPLLARADLLLCASEEERERWLPRVDGRSVEVVPTGDPRDPVRPLRQWLEEPRRTQATTEDVQRLLARWRNEYGVGKPLRWHLARAVWRSLPERARRQLRRPRR